MGLSFVAVFLTAGTMSTSEIVAAQASGARQEIFGFEITLPGWYALMLFPSFLIYFISAVGETNRAPFDLPEAESELVGGFHTEYSSLKFALFFLAEYINMVTVSGLCVTLFLGGWRAPAPITTFWEGANSGWWPLLWFTIKVLMLLFVFVWLRGTLPRLRYDQFMRFGWKVLVPLNLVWILLVAGVRVAPQAEPGFRVAMFAAFALVLLLVIWKWPSGKPVAEPLEVPSRGTQSASGGFPLPPMDLVVPSSPRTKRIEPAETGAAPASGGTARTEQGE